MKKEEIEKLIKKGESKNLEFKETLNLKDEIGEAVSAFSNSFGGIILVGVSDKGEIKGVQLGKNTIEEFVNYVKQHTDNSIYLDLESQSIEGKEIFIIYANECEEKPVFFKGRAYTRVGKSTHKLSASEIRKLARESAKIYWDEKICKETRLKDIGKKKIEWYLSQREKHRNIPKKMKISLNLFLENIKAFKKRKPTNAGILFFGENPLKFISQAQLRLIKIKGNEIGGIILDRLDCSGTLWEMIEQAEEFFKKHINFIGIRSEKSFQREDKFDIPIRALRELVINALIHRDYESNADVRVFIFDNRVEIINPGNFPKGVSPKKPLHKPVNKLLSQYMYDIGFVEKYGSGIIFVRNLLKENGNKDLEYVLHEIETKAIVYSQILIKKEADGKVTESQEILTEKIGAKLMQELNDRQKSAVDFLLKNFKLTTKDYLEITKTSLRTARRDLNHLIEIGLILRKGSAKTGFYMLKNGTANGTANGTVDFDKYLNNNSSNENEK